jgi:hypothetical protein
MEHITSNCPKRQEAVQRKRKSYAQALLGASQPPKPINNTHRLLPEKLTNDSRLISPLAITKAASDLGAAILSAKEMDLENLTLVIENSLKKLLTGFMRREESLTQADSDRQRDPIPRHSSMKIIPRQAPAPQVRSDRQRDTSPVNSSTKNTPRQQFKGSYRDAIASIDATRMDVDRCTSMSALDLAVLPSSRGSTEMSRFLLPYPGAFFDLTGRESMDDDASHPYIL